MEQKFYYAPVTAPRCGNALDHPWDHAVPLYRMAPHVWQVGGQDDVCAYLLDSGEGLIMIDTGYEETMYMLVNNIHEAGFKPKDIKKILLTHWHGDHVNGARILQEMSGAEIWLSKEDNPWHLQYINRPGRIPTKPFQVDHFYNNDETIDLGRFSIHTKLVPGHTPGATAMWFTDTDEETGESYVCAIHGGLGVDSMRPDRIGVEGITADMPDRFIRDCEELAKMHVDIHIPSHLNQANIVPNIPEDPMEWKCFVADYSWPSTLLNRAEKVKSFWPEKYGK